MVHLIVDITKPGTECVVIALTSEKKAKVFRAGYAKENGKTEQQVLLVSRKVV